MPLFSREAYWTSFAPAIKQRFPRVNVIAWMHNNVDIYLNQYYVKCKMNWSQGS
jgi:hypothetical protein